MNFDTLITLESSFSNILFFEKDHKYTISGDNSIKTYYQDIALLIRNFKNFYEWWKKEHILIKSEFVVGDEETGICGSIDNLSYNFVKKEFVMFDYKTNKEIKMKNPRKEKLLYSLSHLDNCEYSKYSLQLSLYSTIIEKVTEFKVPKSFIVWVNGENDYELIQCLDLKKESLLLLNNQYEI